MKQPEIKEMALVDQEQLKEVERRKRERDQNGPQFSKSEASGSFVFQIESPKENNIQLFLQQAKINQQRKGLSQKAKQVVTPPSTPFGYQVQLVSQQPECNQQLGLHEKGNRNDYLDKKQELEISETQARIKNNNHVDKIIQNQTEDRKRRRKRKSGYKDILNGSQGIQQNTKISQSVQNRNQGKNIEYGKIQVHSQQPTQNQKKDAPLRGPLKKDPQTSKQKQRESKQGKKLPPLKRQQSRKQELQPTFLYQNDNSIMALQKFMNSCNQNNGQANYEPEVFNHFAFKPITTETNIKFLFKRQKIWMQNYYHPQYSLIFNLNKLIFNAKKEWGHLNSHYNISCEEKNYSKQSKYYAGYLKGNFAGTKFNLFSCHDQQSELVATIVYKADLSCIQLKYRQFQVYVKTQDYTYSQLAGHLQGQTIDLQELYQVSDNASARKIVKLVNKQAEWNQKFDAFVMNFKGKLKMASVKNTILVEEGRLQPYVLMLCKQQENQFYLQVGHPLDPFMAMGIVLSSFDFKLFCQ